MKSENVKTQYAGIDYGLGQSNINKQTGIRNGVIPQNDVGQAWWDDSEPYYGKPDSVECSDCGHVIRTKDMDWGDIVHCEECDTDTECELPDCAEPVSHFYEQGGYSAECGEHGDIFVCRSPYFTYAQFCSPCAPGACHLRNPLDLEASCADGVKLDEAFKNNRAYCFGHDWFEDGVAPYPVYSVETGELVQPTH